MTKAVLASFSTVCEKHYAQPVLTVCQIKEKNDWCIENEADYHNSVMLRKWKTQGNQDQALQKKPFNFIPGGILILV